LKFRNDQKNRDARAHCARPTKEELQHLYAVLALTARFSRQNCVLSNDLLDKEEAHKQIKQNPKMIPQPIKDH